MVNTEHVKGRLQLRFEWIIVAVLLFTYSPLYLSDYAVGDDHVLMFSDLPFEHAYLSDGRPLFALAHNVVHRPIDHLYQLAYLRFVAVLLVVVLSLLFYRLARHLGGTAVERSAFAICLATLPCIHDYIAQANFWLAPFAGICSCLSCMFTFRALSTKAEGIHQRVAQWTIPVAFILCAGLIYQPMLSFYWAVTLVFALDPRFIRSAQYRQQIAKLIIAGLVFFCISFIAFKVALAFSPVGAKERTALMSDPLEKFYWFLRIQLPLAFNYWHLMISGTRLVPLVIAMGTSMLIAIGFCVSWRKRREAKAFSSGPKYMLWIALVIVLLMLSHVHWLAIADVPQGYRIIASLGVSAWILLYWAYRQWISMLPSPSRPRIRVCGLLAAAFMAVMLCRYYSDAYWVTPSSLAHRYMLFSLQEGLNGGIEQVHVVRQGREHGLVESYFIESFARPLSEPPWIIEDWVKLSLRDLRLSHAVKKITHSGPDEPVPIGSATLVVDMRKLAAFRIPSGRF